MTTTTAQVDKDQLAAQAYDVLQANGGNATEAAKSMDMARTTFRALITRHLANLESAEQTDAPALDETGNVPSDQCETPASDYYTDTDEAIADGIAAAIESGDMTVFQPAADPEPVADDKPAKSRKTRTAKAADAKGDDDLPEGFLTPVAFHHLLADKGIIDPAKVTTQIVYSWLKTKRNPFPVSWFDANGAQFVDKAPGRRPAVSVESGIAWATAWVAAH